MSFWNPHDDGQLNALAAGTLSHRGRARALGHLRGCERCASRYERLVQAERALAGGAPWQASPQELENLKRANLRAALSAARPAAPKSAPGWTRGLAPALAVALVALTGAWVLSGPRTSSQFTARGGEAPTVAAAALRVFCVAPGAAPAELAQDGACPSGSTLALSARFERPPPSVTVELLGGATEVRQVIPIDLAANEEQALPRTFALEGDGAREVLLRFGDRTLRHTLRVESPR